MAVPDNLPNDTLHQKTHIAFRMRELGREERDEAIRAAGNVIDARLALSRRRPMRVSGEDCA